MTREMNREEWTALWYEMRGDDLDERVKATVTSDPSSAASIECGDGLASVEVGVYADATDIRVGEVQLLVGRNRAALIVSHPPYPISRWTVLWEGLIDA